MSKDRPGKEIPKEYREIIEHLIDTQGWRYDGSRKHPVVTPPDKTKPQVVLAATPSDRRAIKNFVAQVRRSGGIWPPRKEQ